MFCISGRQTSSEFLHRNAYAMADKYIEESADKKLSQDHITEITDYINKQELIPKKVFILLDIIASLVFATFAILGFTGVLPNIALGGNIAMITIGCINFILLAICAPTTRDIKLPPELEERFHKNFIDKAVHNRIQHHF